MDKPFIIEYAETKQDIIDAVNKHIEAVPAIFIADFLDRLSAQFRDLGNSQVEAARAKFEQSLESAE